MPGKGLEITQVGWGHSSVLLRQTRQALITFFSFSVLRSVVQPAGLKLIISHLSFPTTFFLGFHDELVRWLGQRLLEFGLCLYVFPLAVEATKLSVLFTIAEISGKT